MSLFNSYELDESCSRSSTKVNAALQAYAKCPKDLCIGDSLDSFAEDCGATKTSCFCSVDTLLFLDEGIASAFL